MIAKIIPDIDKTPIQMSKKRQTDKAFLSDSRVGDTYKKDESSVGIF